ncbi:hypothetical protein NBRC3257_1521 [Gluconobacter thailandicus NBRC 3257]|uniref:Uncharacterized protein n=1 Tax=Gluconobacter thailandicus NBRC 3257 TaxID=1381097 RepID=A0ABQ0IWD2_GLUTH|nr:hypothetical protein NBRC3255_2751 [Gluconobacter thailandicus NBRC 3255]GAD26522.1 hypothetical protein NBRC3257_1521 [Gluconobacter thailandicus NBRC 3257]
MMTVPEKADFAPQKEAEDNDYVDRQAFKPPVLHKKCK